MSEEDQQAFPHVLLRKRAGVVPAFPAHIVLAVEGAEAAGGNGTDAENRFMLPDIGNLSMACYQIMVYICYIRDKTDVAFFCHIARRKMEKRSMGVYYLIQSRPFDAYPFSTVLIYKSRILLDG